jgi:hypothetical protein
MPEDRNLGKTESVSSNKMDKTGLLLKEKYSIRYTEIPENDQFHAQDERTSAASQYCRSWKVNRASAAGDRGESE